MRSGQAPLFSSPRSEAPNDPFSSSNPVCTRPYTWWRRKSWPPACSPTARSGALGWRRRSLRVASQRPALLDGGVDQRCASGGSSRSYLSHLSSLSKIPINSGHRNTEGPYHFLLGDATVHRVKHLQSQIERIRFHPGSFL